MNTAVKSRRLLGLLLFICAASLLVVACQPAAPAPGGAATQLNITAGDYTFEAPESVSAGWVNVKLNNTGQEPHHVQFMRLNDGVTLDQFIEALQQGEGPALALVSLRGGVGQVMGETPANQATLDLPAGTYVLVCFVPSPDGVPHIAKGMLRPLMVVDPAGTAGEPQASVTVTMRDFAFDQPDTLPAGPTTIRLDNAGPQFHEWNLLQLAEGASADSVVAWFADPAGPPPFSTVGGINGLDAGLHGYVQADLPAGQYLAICFIPDPASGAPHFALGMAREFSVR
jgi:hypothetical protein